MLGVLIISHEEDLYSLDTGTDISQEEGDTQESSVGTLPPGAHHYAEELGVTLPPGDHHYAEELGVTPPPGDHHYYVEELAEEGLGGFINLFDGNSKYNCYGSLNDFIVLQLYEGLLKFVCRLIASSS